MNACMKKKAAFDPADRMPAVGLVSCFLFSGYLFSLDFLQTAALLQG